MSIGRYLKRSLDKLLENTSAVIHMRGADSPPVMRKSLYTFHSQEELKEFVTGSDRDMGGASTAKLELNEEGKGVFRGSLRATVMTSRGILGGYAAIRSRNRPTMFGPMLSDVTFHKYLGMRCRVGGSFQTRNSYFVNIQTDEVAQSTEIWQHRLYFPKGDGSWEDIFIPFDNFICTNAGTIVEPLSPHSPRHSSVTMSKDRIRTIGISLLGSPENDGDFELDIDELWAVNNNGIPDKEEGQVLLKNDAAEKLSSPSPSMSQPEKVE